MDPGQDRFGEEDPAAAFLQREHEELGDIGDEILGEPTNQSEDAGLEGREEELQFGDEPEELMVPHDDLYSAIASEDVLAAEPECIRQWRREQEERLAKKDAAEQEAVEEQRQLAQHELEELYKRMDEQLEQTKARNREAEDAFIAERDADDPGHEWERVAKMCDFSGKGSRTTKDVSRMRSIFLHLKQDPLVR